MVRLLIVTGIRLYREGLARVLATDGRFDVVRTAATMDEALTELAARPLDVVLLDAAGPAALAGVAVLAESSPDTSVVALGIGDSESEIIAYAEAGAAGYVPRDASVADLIVTVESAARGELRCSPRTAGALLRRLAHLAGQRAPVDDPQLTHREIEVVRLIDSGLTNKEIAAELCIEVATVKNHVHNIIEKLGVRRRGEAAAMMRRWQRPGYGSVPGSPRESGAPPSLNHSI
jgi:DNA-binding NarL/FixJ family response regulator